MQKNNQGQQTEMVKKKLISLIKSSKLKIGDKLPPQAELREKLSVGSKTIQRAIDTLEMCGILEVRPHKGVFIKRLETNGLIGHEIGLVCMWRTFYPVAASLMQCLQLQLSRNACQCKLFLRNFSEMTAVDSLSYFDGLKRCIEQGQIQGLITTVSFDDEAWDFLKKHKIPVVSLGSAAFNKGFKVCDFNNLADFFKLAEKRGLQRPALLHCGFPVTEKIRNSFIENCSLDPEIYCRFMQTDMQIEDKPFEWTEKLKFILQNFSIMPENKRPDVLLIPDDMIMNIAYHEILHLKKNGSDWNPYFIYTTNKQIPIMPHGSIKGDYFEYDIMETADTAVKLLLDIICEKENESEIIYIHPQHFHVV